MDTTSDGPSGQDPSGSNAPDPPGGAVATGERGGFVGSVTDRIKAGGLPARTALPALAVVLFLACSVAVVWVSALQAQVPRNMPFGVTGTSPVVTAAERRRSRVTGSRSSTRPTPARPPRWTRSTRGRSMAPTSRERAATRCSRPGQELLRVHRDRAPVRGDGGKAGSAAACLGGQAVAGREGSGGRGRGHAAVGDGRRRLVAAILVFTLTGLAVQRWRTASLLGITLLAALLTDVLAGPVFGAYAGDSSGRCCPACGLSPLPRWSGPRCSPCCRA